LRASSSVAVSRNVILYMPRKLTFLHSLFYLSMNQQGQDGAANQQNSGVEIRNMRPPIFPPRDNADDPVNDQNPPRDNVDRNAPPNQQNSGVEIRKMRPPIFPPRDNADDPVNQNPPPDNVDRNDPPNQDHASSYTSCLTLGGLRSEHP
jgi:hypothetical protein